MGRGERVVRTDEDGWREGVVLVFVVLCSRCVLVLYPRCCIVIPYSGRLVVVRCCCVSRCGHGNCGVVVDVDVVWCGYGVVVVFMK